MRDRIAGWAAVLLVVGLAMYCSLMAERNFDDWKDGIATWLSEEEE